MKRFAHMILVLAITAILFVNANEEPKKEKEERPKPDFLLHQ